MESRAQAESQRRVNTKDDDTSNLGFLSIPHKSFVIVNVIAFFKKPIVYLKRIPWISVSIYS